MLITIEDESVPLDPKRAEALAAAIFAGEGERLRVSVVVIDDEAMAELHGQTHDDPTTTDVISFDLRGDGPGEDCPDDVDGELVVNGPMAAREAAERGHGAEAELLFYVAHGLLHLLGHDDQTDADREQMHALQRHYLSAIGISVGE
jgi:probable rRNA maturation factor